MNADELITLLSDTKVKEHLQTITDYNVDDLIQKQLTSTSLAQTLGEPKVIAALQRILGKATNDKNAENAMHYGNLRFAVYSASIVIIGGMLAMYLNDDYHKTFTTGNIRWYFGWAGFGMALSLGIVQHRINENLFFYQKQAGLAGTITELNGVAIWKWIARTIMLAPYAAAMACWWMLMYRSELFETH